MEFHWLNRAGGGDLIVFVLGWAADHRVVEHIRPDGYDILAVYDYVEGLGGGREVAHKAAQGYSRVYLFAWSFGVWVAGQLFDGIETARAVALNGTPRPVDALYGIEPRRMAVTIRGLRAGGTDVFNRRAYGEYFERLRPVLAPRPPERNIAELEWLASASVPALATEGQAPAFEWDKAIVGTEDLIFPPENMLRYWGSRAETLPLPHYPFADGGLIEKELGPR